MSIPAIGAMEQKEKAFSKTLECVSNYLIEVLKSDKFIKVTSNSVLMGTINILNGHSGGVFKRTDLNSENVNLLTTMCNTFGVLSLNENINIKFKQEGYFLSLVIESHVLIYKIVKRM